MWFEPSDVGAPDPGWTSREPSLMKRVPFFLSLEFQIEGFLASCCSRRCPGPHLGQPVQEAQLAGSDDRDAETSTYFSRQSPHQIVPCLPPLRTAHVFCPRFRKDLYKFGEVGRNIAPRAGHQAPTVEATEISETGD